MRRSIRPSKMLRAWVEWKALEEPATQERTPPAHERAPLLAAE